MRENTSSRTSLSGSSTDAEFLAEVEQRVQFLNFPVQASGSPVSARRWYGTCRWRWRRYSPATAGRSFRGRQDASRSRAGRRRAHRSVRARSESGMRISQSVFAEERHPGMTLGIHAVDVLQAARKRADGSEHRPTPLRGMPFTISTTVRAIRHGQEDRSPAAGQQLPHEGQQDMAEDESEIER